MTNTCCRIQDLNELSIWIPTHMLKITSNAVAIIRNSINSTGKISNNFFIVNHHFILQPFNKFWQQFLSHLFIYLSAVTTRSFGRGTIHG